MKRGGKGRQGKKPAQEAGQPEGKDQEPAAQPKRPSPQKGRGTREKGKRQEAGEPEGKDQEPA